MKISKPKVVQTYEHTSIKANDRHGLDMDDIELLQLTAEERNWSFYAPCFKGIRFSQYVGVIQVGHITLEVLPKVDKVNLSADQEEEVKGWRGILMEMLRIAGLVPTDTNTYGNLQLRNQPVLEVYLSFFLQECERLLYRGLIKKYRKTEGNLNALKGSLQFNKHVSANVVHQERFYVQYTTYDRDHNFNRILLQAIRCIRKLNVSPALKGKAAQLELLFPELPSIHVSQETFDRLKWDRKTEDYRKGIEIARLILLNFHPDIRSGNDQVLALMFDMNYLWEMYVLYILRKAGIEKSGVEIIDQLPTGFWRPEGGRSRSIRADILLKFPGNRTVVLDTKWRISGGVPSEGELKQMYAYVQYYKANECILLYPEAQSNKFLSGSLGHFLCVENRKENYKPTGIWGLCLLKDGRLNREAGGDLFQAIEEFGGYQYTS